MRRPSLVVLAAVLAIVLCNGLGSAAQGPTVPARLDALLAAGAIDPAHHDAWAADYDRAKATLHRLRGVRRRQLARVLAVTRGLAAGGRLDATRAPLVFLTLERNRAWWAAARVPRPNERVLFRGSDLVWQFYPGEGLQVQWLATFGRANGLFQGGTRYDPRLRALLDQAIGLAAARAGGIAWESLFRFDGGVPPWVSGLTQGTAVQALARAAVRLGDPRYFQAARAGLGIFHQPPPEGVLVPTPLGVHYLQYSFAPSLHILNGFIQALNGLHDFAALANDPDGRALFAAGEAQARAELRAFDTGAWSLYSIPGPESDVGYHRLARDFLQGLCGRLRSDAARGLPVADPTLYCETAGRFTAYLRQPPVLALVPTAQPRLRRVARVAFTVDKRSTVTLVLRRAGRAVLTRSLLLGRGRHSFAYRARRRGRLAVALRAVDPAGNAAAVTGTVRVRGGK